MNTQPFVSVIMPARNAARYLEKSLRALKRSDYPYLEIIVVDDASTDATAKIAQAHADSLIILNKRYAPAYARNQGVRRSGGDILFFIDADVTVHTDTITLAVDAFCTDSGLVAVFGSYDAQPYEQNFCSQYKNLFHHFIHQTARPQARTFWAGCGAIRKKIFLEVGGFKESYQAASIEDVELGYRLTERGYAVRLLRHMQVTHLKRWTLKRLLRADIKYRALPWTRLAAHKGLPHDLNFKTKDRASGMLACLLLATGVATLFAPGALLPGLPVAMMLLALNRKLYFFFMQQRGIRFAILSILFHWVYLAYSSAAFLILMPFFKMRMLFPARSRVPAEGKSDDSDSRNEYPSSLPRVLMGIVNFNGGEELTRCLESVRNISYSHECLSVIVVDNNSNDGSCQNIHAIFPRARIIRNTANIGYVRACNQVVAQGLKEDFDYIWLCNNDVVFADTVLIHLVHAAQSRETIGVAAPLIYSRDAPSKVANAGYRINMWIGWLRRLRYGKEIFTQPQERVSDVDSILGCSNLIKTSVFKTIGCLNPAYELYFEETDFNTRARKAGFRVVVARNARVWHTNAATMNKHIFRRAYLLLRNLFLFERFNADRKHLAVFIPYYFLIHIPYFFLRGGFCGIRTIFKNRRPAVAKAVNGDG